MLHFKGFSRTAGRTLAQALRLAGKQGQPKASTGHLLMAILMQTSDPAASFLRARRITAAQVELRLQGLGQGRPLHLKAGDLLPETQKALDYALLGARAAQRKEADNEHLLCAMLEDPACTASVWLRELGLELTETARDCRRMSGQLVLPASPRPLGYNTRSARSSDKYGRDLTRLAAEHRLDPVLCREAELDRMIQILCRRQKNNPCLIGEPGVGKTALAEALAQRIAEGKVPQNLQGKRLLSLDMALMVAGTKYRGDFEERFRNLLEELIREQNTILFIDEIHVVVGAGAAEGAIDAASILKPLLARGELQLIGATTQEEYRRCIQKDAALERRFGKVTVEEPTPSNAAKILQGLAPKYERYHGVTLLPQTIQAAVELSVRYLPGRFLPDKAVDLLDEASAGVRIRAGADRSQPQIVAPEDVAEVVSRASGVPVSRVNEEQRERLARLEQRMAERVVGQSQAVQAVAGAVRRSRTGLRAEGCPMGAMLFLGPTGVGKTHLARVLAESWFGSPRALLRFDMSEYMEAHTVARLIGAPPGYVGHEEGGQLTEAVRRRPYSVVLFDEIEKAHSDLQNILLQILEDGQLTDAAGRKTNFSNCIILLTSNLGARQLTGQGAPLGFGRQEAALERQKQLAIAEAKAYFRPELMGRLDEVVVFHPLEEKDLTAIAEQLLNQLEQRAAKNGYRLHHASELPAALAKRAKSPYGARELRRTVVRAVEQALADRIASGEAMPGASFTACLQNEQVVLEADNAVTLH